MSTSLYLHPEYSKWSQRWKLIRTVVEGKEALYLAGEDYLPRPIGRDDTDYDSYSKRAPLYAVTSKTVEGLLGGIFRKKPVAVLPPELSYLEDNADGRGTPLKDLAKIVAKDDIEIGRFGLLVEYPKAKYSNRAEELKGNPRAFIKPYTAESILDWGTRIINSEEILDYIKIQEQYLASEEGTTRTYLPQCRVLRLTAGGIYQQEIYRHKEFEVDDVAAGTLGSSSHPVKKKIKREVKIETITPLLPDSKPLTYIPFTFVGATSLNWSVDKPPIYDLAALNLSHYQLGADLAEALYVAGQPILTITGLDEQFIEEHRGEIRIGIKEALLLPDDAKVDFATWKAESNGLLKQQAALEKQMLSLGARISQDNANTGSESIESTKMRVSGDANLLANIATNVSSALDRCLRWAGAWMGVAESTTITYSLNKDYNAGAISPAAMKELRETWLAGLLPKTVVFDQLRKGEVIPESFTDEELERLLEEEDIDTMDEEVPSTIVEAEEDE